MKKEEKNYSPLHIAYDSRLVSRVVTAMNMLNNLEAIANPEFHFWIDGNVMGIAKHIGDDEWVLVHRGEEFSLGVFKGKYKPKSNEKR